MNSETLPALLSDGAGGAIIIFFLGTNGCRAARLNSSGVSQWGNTVLSSLSNNRRPAIVADGSGGAVVAWASGNTGIFAQRVTSAGDRLWSPANTGVQVSTTGNQCTMVPDGAGGATVAWQDNRTGTNFNIFAQRVDGTGATQWTAEWRPGELRPERPTRSHDGLRRRDGCDPDLVRRTLAAPRATISMPSASMPREHPSGPPTGWRCARSRTTSRFPRSQRMALAARS